MVPILTVYGNNTASCPRLISSLVIVICSCKFRIMKFSDIKEVFATVRIRQAVGADKHSPNFILFYIQ